MKKILCLLIAVALSVNGYSQSRRRLEKEMNSWKGSTKHELLMGYGPASRSASDGDGGEILVFSDVITKSNPSLVPDGNGGLMVQQNMPYVYYLHKMYYINKDGIVYHWRWQRNQVPPERLMIGGNLDINVYSR
ncbi:MAG TPA: hypothetical protein VK167_11600 [Flavipsychrobacter sp.]|nr:hypothetical protein [Flavipsychrobacter sp.]